MSTPLVSPLINEVNLPNFRHGRASCRPPVGMDEKFENLFLKIDDCCGDSTDPGSTDPGEKGSFDAAIPPIRVTYFS